MSSSGKASFKDMARSIVGDLQQIITRTLLMKAVAGIGGAISGYFAPTSTPQLTASGVGFGMNGSSGFLSGARANGGFVGANRAYLVGERGPEILQMGSQSGQVISNEKSFGGSTIINIDARGATAGVEQQIKRVMGEVLNLKKQVPNIAISAVREQNSRNAGFLR
jgi:lambda family phage tail tape measure protein